MSDAPNNPSVFPGLERVGRVAQSSGGMTLRDYFAAAAMQAIYHATPRPDYAGKIAEHAYVMADAMLREREP
jgi:hypothetical protein